MRSIRREKRRENKEEEKEERKKGAINNKRIIEKRIT